MIISKQVIFIGISSACGWDVVPLSGLVFLLVPCFVIGFKGRRDLHSLGHCPFNDYSKESTKID
jgi:hypothetical protein